jgi:hypothetical protein
MRNFAHIKNTIVKEFLSESWGQLRSFKSINFNKSSHLPGTLSGGTRKLIQDTITNIPETITNINTHNILKLQVRSYVKITNIPQLTKNFFTQYNLLET